MSHHLGCAKVRLRHMVHLRRTPSENLPWEKPYPEATVAFTPFTHTSLHISNSHFCETDGLSILHSFSHTFADSLSTRSGSFRKRVFSNFVLHLSSAHCYFCSVFFRKHFFDAKVFWMEEKSFLLISRPRFEFLLYRHHIVRGVGKTLHRNLFRITEQTKINFHLHQNFQHLVDDGEF